MRNQLLCQQRLLCMCYQKAKDLVLKITSNGEKEDWPAYKTIIMAYTENQNVAYTLNRDIVELFPNINTILEKGIQLTQRSSRLLKIVCA